MEELKLIIEAVQGVSGDAKGLIIMYLIRGYVQLFLVVSVIAYLISLADKLIHKAIATCAFGEKVISTARFKNRIHETDKQDVIIKHLQNNVIDGKSE